MVTVKGKDLMRDYVLKTESLVRELLLMGYYRFQVLDMIKEAAGTSDWRSLSDGKLSEVTVNLEKMVEFARKCRQIPG